jgi:L,D-transpeptidase catalytic domain
MRRLVISFVTLVIVGNVQPVAAEPGLLAGGGAAVPAIAMAPPAPVIAAAPAKPLPPAITLTANINLTSQRMTVAAHGKTLHTWAISSGARGYETPAGNFKPQWQSKLWHSRTYDNAPMPHAVFFNDGIAVHATTSIGRLGSPASHGCIRLSPANSSTTRSPRAVNGLKPRRSTCVQTASINTAARATTPTNRSRSRASFIEPQVIMHHRLTRPRNTIVTIDVDCQY